jgi:hypothetical protein
MAFAIPPSRFHSADDLQHHLDTAITQIFLDLADAQDAEMEHRGRQ